jgi:hypothetical protein
MITVRSDQRVVVVDIDGSDAEPIGAWPQRGRLVPALATVVVDLPTHRVMSVSIQGPRLTESGKPHATQRRSWCWSSAGVTPSGWDEFASMWPPTSAPDVALDVVNAHASASIR